MVCVWGGGGNCHPWGRGAGGHGGRGGYRTTRFSGWHFECGRSTRPVCCAASDDWPSHRLCGPVTLSPPTERLPCRALVPTPALRWGGLHGHQHLAPEVHKGKPLSPSLCSGAGRSPPAASTSASIRPSAASTAPRGFPMSNSGLLVLHRRPEARESRLSQPTDPASPPPPPSPPRPGIVQLGRDPFRKVWTPQTVGGMQRSPFDSPTPP